MKKRVLGILLSLMMVAGVLSGCSLKSPDSSATEETKKESGEEKKADAADTEAEVTLVMAEVNPLETISGQMDNAFKEKVEELSGGSIKIDLQPSAVLGAENDVLDTMLGGGGTIDISRISAFALTSYGAEKSSLLSVPFTFADREHYWNFVESDLADEFLLEPHDAGLGVRGLFYGEEGFRHFFTVKEVSGVEDLSGMKLRVSNDPVMTGMVSGLGANATVVSFNELYSALQTGVVDGAEQPIANYKSNAFNEVAANLILDGHTLGATQVIITDEAWDSLSEEQQKILTEAGEYASQQNKTNSEKSENEVLEELKTEGCNVIEVDDKTPWKDACKDVIESSTKDNAELYQQILDLE